MQVIANRLEKLYGDESTADMTLVCGDRQFRVHSFVLGFFTDYFSAHIDRSNELVAVMEIDNPKVLSGYFCLRLCSGSTAYNSNPDLMIVK